jgi:cyclopropane fatty-acyl-phospholipid synthase-like methyltransferase
MNRAENDDHRALSREVAKALPPGARHYTAYVGPPEQYDFMGATQFRLLTTLGLREHHSVLDFGCGSLRVGRLLIPYLLEGRYYGLEPNQWLIDDAIDRELSRPLIDLKRPTFLHHSDFSATAFGVSFDFILAQSIFSHAGRDLVSRCLAEFRSCLEKSGLILVTFVQPHQLGTTEEFSGSGWVYPTCVAYKLETVVAIIEAAGLVGRALPWFHPRQTWFAMAHSPADLPAEADDAHLSGVVLRAPGLAPTPMG